MLLRSTTKPPILGILTNTHISEAFRIDRLLMNRCFYGQKQNHKFVVFGGGLTKHSWFLYEGGNRASV